MSKLSDSSTSDQQLLALQALFQQERLSVLEPWQRSLFNDSLTAAQVWQHVAPKTKLFDYSQIVFPASKAYEGFLKQFLFSLGMISKQTYLSKRFRIGRALNPDVYPNQRDDWWLYDDVVKACGSEIAHQLWETWLECRNRLFHYFPGKSVQLSYLDALLVLSTIGTTINTAVEAKHSQLLSQQQHLTKD